MRRGHPLGLSPTKVVAVHLSYRSRAAERGRTPVRPSYFLKPPSTLAASGDPVARPAGCELLAFEGEIAVVIGTRARRVAPGAALAHVAGVAAANDFGVYDLRYADGGSNVRSKGWDGSTPLGPELIPLDEVDPEALVLRTWVDGELVQEASTAELLFSLAELVSDVSHAMTLEPDDVILCGTPAGSRVVAPGSVVEVELAGRGRLRSPIVDDAAPAGALAPPPRPTPEARAAAMGVNGARRVELPAATIAQLRAASTATLTSQLLGRGISATFLGGLVPTRPDLRMVGYARTLRYVPLREDVRDELTRGLNAQKRTIDSLSPDDVLVIEARGHDGAGTCGDILALRALRRGAAGIVTDGGLRDSPAFADLDLPVYRGAVHAAPLSRVHLPLDADIPIGCAGVLVFPGDVIVGDAEGAVVIPAALAVEVAEAATLQEEQERFVAERVDAGESIDGLYPPKGARLAELEAWRAARRASSPSTDPGDA